jgi:ABC-type nitrate/sulfonate/bicarbonate transport system substrate-binding protein
MSKPWKCLLVGLALLALADNAAIAQEPIRITIGLASGSLPSSAPRFAQQMGLFQKHGLDPKITIMEDASIATMGLISGTLDFNVAAPSDAIIANARGQSLGVVATVYGGYSPALVLSRKFAEETKVSPTAPVAERIKALDNLVIASTSATSNFTLGIKCAMATTRSTPRLTFMSQPAMVAALESGAVQAFIASAPFYGISAIKGSGVIWLSGPKGEYPEGCATTYAATINSSVAYAKANPEAIRRVRAVFADFAEAVRQRPNDVKAAIGTLFPDIDKATIDLLFQSESLGYSASPPTAEGLAREVAFVKLSGVPVPNLDSIDPAKLLIP